MHKLHLSEIQSLPHHEMSLKCILPKIAVSSEIPWSGSQTGSVCYRLWFSVFSSGWSDLEKRAFGSSKSYGYIFLSQQVHKKLRNQLGSRCTVCGWIPKRGDGGGLWEGRWVSCISEVSTGE